jgi:hypothetical protein
MVTFVNFDKATAADITSDSIYALIENGEWTIDKFLEIVDGYDYLDANNNYTVDAGDDMRLTAVKWSEALDGYYAAFDLKLLEENDDGSHTITIDGNTRLQVGTEKIAELYSYDGIFLGDTGSAFNMFINGYSLFHTDILYRNAQQNAQLRNASFNYGVLPLPLYDTDQYDTKKDSLGYYTTSQDAYNAISVLKTHPEKLEMVSAFLEVLASDSYNNCRPYYVEKMIKGEYVQDAKSVKMVEIVMDGITFETAWLYSFQVGRFAYNIWRSSANGSKPFAENWAGLQVKAVDDVKTFDMWFEGTQGIE